MEQTATKMYDSDHCPAQRDLRLQGLSLPLEIFLLDLRDLELDESQSLSHVWSYCKYYIYILS